MINPSKKQAFLIATTQLSRYNIRMYQQIEKAVANLGDVFFLYHDNTGAATDTYRAVKIESFGDDILTNLNYKPIAKTLLPGSNHFPILKFFLKRPEYSHYWYIEDDVAFNGNWQLFFNDLSNHPEYDFITSHIKTYNDVPNWTWWNTLLTPTEEVGNTDLYKSFNPIYRISARALQHIDDCLKNGYSGHHEVVFATLLTKAGFKLADFSQHENRVTPLFSYCTPTTMRWRPAFFVMGGQKNNLYHPVKNKAAFFKHILHYCHNKLVKK